MTDFYKTKKFWLFAPLILVPFLLTLGLVVKYAVNVPYMDEWELVRLFHHLQSGHLTIGNFWVQHNEHRIFFISMTTVGLGHLTHWNLGAQMLVSLTLALGMLGIFCAYTKREVKTGAQYILYLTLISTVLFSWVQWENWVRGFQMQWFFCLFPGVLALYLLDARAKIWNYNARFLLAAFLCVVSSYSLGSGVFFWLACFVPLIAIRQSVRRLLVWGVAAVSCLALYFYHYLFLPQVSGQPTFKQCIKFFFAYLGNVFTPDVGMAVTLGAIIFGLTGLSLYYALVIKRISLKNLALPTGLIVFVLMSDLITMHSRVGNVGAAAAMTSRYTSISTLMVIALILVYMHLHRASKSVMPPLFLGVVIVPLVFGISLVGLSDTRAIHSTLTGVKTCLHQPAPTDACIGSAHPNITRTRTDLQFLKQQHLAGF